MDEDLEGNARPVGAAADLGVYEYSGTGVEIYNLQLPICNCPTPLSQVLYYDQFRGKLYNLCGNAVYPRGSGMYLIRANEIPGWQKVMLLK